MGEPIPPTDYLDTRRKGIDQAHPLKESLKDRIDRLNPTIRRRFALGISAAALVGTAAVVAASGTANSELQQEQKDTQSNMAETQQMFHPNGYSQKEIILGVNDISNAETVDTLNAIRTEQPYDLINSDQVTTLDNVPIDENHRVIVDKPLETDLTQFGLGEYYNATLGMKDGTKVVVIIPKTGVEIIRQGKDKLPLPTDQENVDQINIARPQR